MNTKRKERVRKQKIKQREALTLSRKQQKENEKMEWHSREKKQPCRKEPVIPDGLAKIVINKEELTANLADLKALLEQHDNEIAARKNNASSSSANIEDIFKERYEIISPNKINI